MLKYFEHKHEVCALTDLCDKGTKDVDWMRKIIAKWGSSVVALCGDGRIIKNKVERKVLKECNLMFVHLAPGWTNLDWPMWGWKIIKVWPNIVEQVEQAPCPMLFEVKVGSLKVLAISRISAL